MALTVCLGSLLGARNINAPEDSEVNLYRSARPEKAFLIHQTGNLWTALTNFGSIGDPDFEASGRPSAAWPAGTGNSYLYDAGFWVGCELGGVPVLKTYFYNADEKEWLPTSGFPGEIGSRVNGQKSKSLEDSYVIFDDIDSETISGQVALGVKVIRRGLTWGLPDYDDFIVFEYAVINTGLNGDLDDVYISFWYDVDVSGSDDTDKHIDDLVDYDGWDGDDSNTDIADIVDPMNLDNDFEDDGRPKTGYDEYGIPYGKDSGHNPNFALTRIEPDGFYDEWAVILDPDGVPLRWQSDVPADGEFVTHARVAGACAWLNHDNIEPFVDANDNCIYDPDPVNNPDETYTDTNGDGAWNGIEEILIGWQFPRSVSYIYDADNKTSSANDYGERENSQPNDGFLGGALLYTEADKNVLEDGSEFIGASAHQWWNWESDPGVDDERWNFMRGQHSTSGGMRFLRNPVELGFPEFDYRFLLTTGPIDIAEGDTTKLVWVLGIGMGLEGMRSNIDNAYRAYYSGAEHSNPLEPSGYDEDGHWNLPIPPLTPDLSYSPLDKGVRLAWDRRAETDSWDANLDALDFEGYQIYRSIFEPQDWQLIAAFDNLPDSNVFVIHAATGDTLNQQDDDGNWIKVDLPSIVNTCDDGGPDQSKWCYSDDGSTVWGTNLLRALSETDTLPFHPVNGLPYYYTVAAYDGYKQLAGQKILPSYSPLSNYKKTVDGAPDAVVPGQYFEMTNPITKLSKIKVVPNPYRGTALWEQQYQDKIGFVNLPPLCKISIFSLAGDLVIELDHTDGSSTAYWDLVSRNGQSVVSGIYLYVVEAPDVHVTGNASSDKQKHIGKFVVFR